MSDQQGSKVVNLSVGSGIAIFAIWLFAVALVVFAALFFYTDVIVDNTSALDEIKEQGVDGTAMTVAYLFTLLITVLPGFGAYWLTKMMLGKDD